MFIGKMFVHAERSRVHGGMHCYILICVGEENAKTITVVLYAVCEPAFNNAYAHVHHQNTKCDMTILSC